MPIPNPSPVVVQPVAGFTANFIEMRSMSVQRLDNTDDGNGNAKFAATATVTFFAQAKPGDVTSPKIFARNLDGSLQTDTFTVRDAFSAAENVATLATFIESLMAALPVLYALTLQRRADLATARANLVTVQQQLITDGNANAASDVITADRTAVLAAQTAVQAALAALES